MSLRTPAVLAALILLTACGERPVPIARPFAWPLEQTPLATRGGTTTAAALTMAPSPSVAWSALQAAAPGIARDRAAIRAMAGEFRTCFDFQETIGHHPGYLLSAPYHSFATERVFIIEDTAERIVLQHQLVMRFAGSPEVAVIKHWRQAWTWQDGDLLRYRGFATWEHELMPAARVTGCWTQTVSGVGDEPRYATVGRWRHEGTLSEWESDRTWRPLPRREVSVRKDYQALDGSHRITITPDGWVLWQDNRKLTLSAAGTPGPQGWLASEIGLERYQRISGFDWQPGEDAWKSEAPLWEQVRAAWT
nr:hypothetical protein [Planctomycetota bacterium]